MSAETDDKLIDIIKEDEFDPMTFFTKKELCYYKMIDKFYRYCSDDSIVKMIDIIDSKSVISLRILDWFVTKYSKRGVDFIKNGETIDVHINYKAQLKSYRKRYFDPFRRKKKFNYKYNIKNKDYMIYTTIGQLNFFRWAINNDILNFVEINLTAIVKAMNTSNKEEKEKKKSMSDNSSFISDSDIDSEDSDYNDSEYNDSIESFKEETIIRVSKRGPKSNKKIIIHKIYSDNDETDLTLSFD
jgi:hypothetical protein